jgi:hypothetical protein
MNTHVIYYYFSDKSQKVSKDFKNPVIQSIASLRHWSKDVAISVLDVSDCEVDWELYNHHFNFYVHKVNHPLKNLENNLVHVDGASIFSKRLSRPIALYEYASYVKEDLIVSCDANLFWIKDPFPLSGDHFNKFCSNNNSGLWYYNKNVTKCHDFMHTWNTLCAFVMTNYLMCDRVHKTIGRNSIDERACMNFVQHRFPELYSFNPIEENCSFYNTLNENIDVNKIKALHVSSSSFKYCCNEKALACIYIKELREITDKMFGVDDMRYVFGDFVDIVPYSIHDKKRMSWLNEKEPHDRIS